MNERKLPADAFQYYLGLGTGRAYSAVAKHYGVAKGTVVNRAKAEGWQARITEMERAAREQVQRDAQNEMVAVRERQLKGARALQAKALEALRDLPPERAIRAASALNVAWKHELLLLGEATDRNATVVEEVTKREMHALLMKDEEEDDWSQFDGDPTTEQA